METVCIMFRDIQSGNLSIRNIFKALLNICFYQPIRQLILSQSLSDNHLFLFLFIKLLINSPFKKTASTKKNIVSEGIEAWTWVTIRQITRVTINQISLRVEFQLLSETWTCNGLIELQLVDGHILPIINNN